MIGELENGNVLGFDWLHSAMIMSNWFYRVKWER